MDEKCAEEVNNLRRSDVLHILIAKDTTNIEISENLREYFNNLFHIKSANSFPCPKCCELSEELRKIKNDFKECNQSREIAGLRRKKRNKGESTFMNDDDHVGGNEFDKMGIKTSSSETFTLSQLESELKQFYDFCKENKLSDEEIANICKPLLPPINNFHSKFFRYFLIFLLITAILYLLSYFEAVQWHYSAIGRIVLIELLPLWNWKQLKNEKCFIKSLSAESEPPVSQDCTFCEYIHKIDVVDAYQSEMIYQKYIKLHKPVILENGLDNWMEPVDFEGLLRTVLDDEVLSQSVPCKFKSNVYYGSGNLYESLNNIQDNDVYFAHFQNCEFDAVKAFRKYFKRPKFLAPEILPIQYSWLLISNNYNVDKYKPVLLNEQVTVFGQFLGKTHVILHPNECTDDCESLKIELVEGEVLIFSGLWNMEYKPEPESQNLAVILETH